MKLFLSSASISEEQKNAFAKLVGKSLPNISFALIENAADPYPEEKKSFVYSTRETLGGCGMKLKIIDLSQYKNDTEVSGLLKTFDVVWIGGGNTYYIRWLMKKTGFDTAIKNLIKEGLVYGGGSAGAIVAGKTLKYFDLVDDPKLSPEQIYEGLDLSNLILIPHWGVEDFQIKLQEIKDSYNRDGLEVLLLRDDQAIIINGESRQIIPSN